MKTPLLFFLSLLLFGSVTLAHAQASQSAGMTLTVAPYVQLDAGAAPQPIAALGDGITVSGTSPTLTGGIKPQNVTVMTNSATGAALSLAIAGTGPTGAVWDDISLAVSLVATTPGTGANAAVAKSGSSSGNFTARTCTAECPAQQLIGGIRGGQYTYQIGYEVTLATRFALSGARTFNATYTVSL